MERKDITVCRQVNKKSAGQQLTGFVRVDHGLIKKLKFLAVEENTSIKSLNEEALTAYFGIVNGRFERLKD